MCEGRLLRWECSGSISREKVLTRRSTTCLAQTAPSNSPAHEHTPCTGITQVQAAF